MYTLLDPVAGLGAYNAVSFSGRGTIAATISQLSVGEKQGVVWMAVLPFAAEKLPFADCWLSCLDRSLTMRSDFSRDCEGRVITRKIFRRDAQVTRETLELLRNAENALYRLQGVLVVALEASENPDTGEGGGFDFYEQVHRFEMLLIRGALRHAHGSQTKAAQLLGLNLSTLNTKIRIYKINVNDFR